MKWISFAREIFVSAVRVRKVQTFTKNWAPEFQFEIRPEKHKKPRQNRGFSAIGLFRPLIMARSEGFKPSTNGIGIRYSIHWAKSGNCVCATRAHFFVFIFCLSFRHNRAMIISGLYRNYFATISELYLRRIGYILSYHKERNKSS